MGMIDELDHPHIHIQNKEEVAGKLETLLKDGPGTLQIISDYDMTLSRYSIGNKLCPSSHGILGSHIALTPEANEKREMISKKYRAIEVDPYMSVEEKIPYMLEWWGKAHDAMGNKTITRKDIVNAVSNSIATLKDGCNELFEFLHCHSIPLLIFSAGLGDIIEEVIHQKSHYYGNMHLVSNFMNFDENDCMTGFRGQLIHTFNKNEGALEHASYFEEISHRHNIIVMGDMMGDLNMADGVENINTMLTIGYLNVSTPESLSRYMNAWDVVLTEDCTVDVLRRIVSKVVGE